MKPGDLVRMNLRGENAPEDQWGIGVVLRVIYGAEEIEVEIFWSKWGDVGWEMPAFLKVINESR